jgi:hypothetical protein
VSRPSDIAERAGNPHYRADPVRFDEIARLAKASGRWVAKSLSRRPDLAEFIDERLPLLKDACYTVTTKLAWLFSGRTEFPKCEVCGGEFGRGTNVKRPRLYRRTCSGECARRLRAVNGGSTCMEKYGVGNVFQAGFAKEKSARTKELRYGDPAWNNPEKRRLACLAKYGADSNMRSAKGLAEYRAGMKNAHGVEFPMQSGNIRRKAAETCMRRYERPDIQTPETVAKRARTCLGRYGVKTPMQSPEIRRAAQKRYFYDGMSFDSSAELALYIWLRDNNVDFEYQPGVGFEYEHGGKRHVYMPDFRIGGKLYEIKGGQFVSKDGSWVNPYDRTQDALYEVKRRCCATNGVKTPYPAEYRRYVEHCEKRFGSRMWYRSFRKNRIS